MQILYFECKDKHLIFKKHSKQYFELVSDNDDYIINIDIQDERKNAMFLRIVFPDKTWRELAIDTDGNVDIPLWALQFRLIDIGVTSGDSYATLPTKVAVKGSIKAICGEDQIEIPEQSTIDQLIALVNTVVAPDVEVETDTETEYRLKFTSKERSIVTPNLKGQSLIWDEMTPEERAALKGERGEDGVDGIDGTSVAEATIGATGHLILTLTDGTTVDCGNAKGEQGAAFTYDMFTRAQLESLRGEQGIQGEDGKPFQVAKTYGSISEMNLDFDNPDVDEGSFVLISSNEQDPDNAKLFVKGENAYGYITDLSGAQGIKGDRGLQGIQGERGLQGKRGLTGDTGVGIASASFSAEDGTLTLHYDDGTDSDAFYVRGAVGVAGAKGETGNGIESVSFSEGSLTIHYTDGTFSQAFYVKGADGSKGDTGDTGNGIASATIANGYLTLHYTDGTDSEPLYVRGEKGDTGLTGETGATGNGISGATFANGYLTLQFTDGTSSNAFYVKGETGRTGDTGQTGETGNGIDSTTYTDGYLTIHYTDGTDSEPFYVKGGKGDKGDTGLTGQTGETGVGVSTATIDANGHLILTLTNSNTVDAGVAKGNKGDTGSTGVTGNGIASATHNNGYVTFNYTDGTSSNPMYLKGDKGDVGDTGASYVLTNTDKLDIADLVYGLLEAAENGSY